MGALKQIVTHGTRFHVKFTRLRCGRFHGLVVLALGVLIKDKKRSPVQPFNALETSVSPCLPRAGVGE